LVTYGILFTLHLLHPSLVAPFHRPGWVYEEKVDGWRMVAYKTGQAIRFVNRKGLDHTQRFAPLARTIAKLPSAESPFFLDYFGSYTCTSICRWLSLKTIARGRFRRPLFAIRFSK